MKNVLHFQNSTANNHFETNLTTKHKAPRIKIKIKKIEFEGAFNKEMSSGRAYNSEVAIWKAVIMQAVLDIVNTSKRTEHIVAKQAAISWFNINNINFITVCDLAKLEPEWVLKKITYALQNQKIWRRECDIRKVSF